MCHWVMNDKERMDMNMIQLKGLMRYMYTREVFVLLSLRKPGEIEEWEWDLKSWTSQCKRYCDSSETLLIWWR